MHAQDEYSPTEPDPAAWLSELSPRESVRLVLTLSRAVLQRHSVGSLHRSIERAAIIRSTNADAPELCTLSPAPQESLDFGGPFADPELCPPELRGSRVIAVPASLESARRTLTEARVLMTPERIDIYQLGTLLCRLVTGKSIRAYLSSPVTMSRVPRPIRHVIDGCIGYDESSRVESAAALVEQLTATVEEQGLSGEYSPPMLRRDTHVGTADTLVTRRKPPFERLGHFNVHEEIGHGGMGTVYRGYDQSLDRTVALKVLSQRFSNDPDFVQRFKAEAAAAGKLTHPHIVPIYSIGEDAGRHFYAMQFIDGESLAERLQRVGRLSLDEVLAITQQVLLGLAAAHRQGFVHRDIKPGNILLDRLNGIALLTDFGLARVLSAPDEPLEQSLVMGTAEYMSPEQAQGERIDARSDLYSVGVLLYQLLSGQTPFHADTPSSQLIHHVCEQPRPLAEVAPEVEPLLVRIVGRLLQKRPSDRFQSVDELLIELQQIAPLPSSALPLSAILVRPTATQISVGRDAQQRHFGPRLVIGFVFALIAAFVARSSLNSPASRTVPLTEHADPVFALAFSPNGRFVVSGGGKSSSLKDAGDTALRQWDASTGRMLKQSERLPLGPEQLVILDDARRVLALSSAREGTGTLSQWDLETGRQEPAAFAEPFAFHFAAAVVAKSRVLAVGNSGLVELLLDEGRSGTQPRVVRTWPSPLRAIAVCRTASEPCCFVATEADGRPVVVQFGGRSFETRTQLGDFEGPIVGLAANSDGTIVLTRVTTRVEGGDADAVGDQVSAWSWPSKRRLWTRGPYTPGSRVLGLCDDGSRVITLAEPSIGPQSTVPQSAVVLEVAQGRELCRVKSGSPQLLSAAISPDGSEAVLGDAEGRVVFCRLPVVKSSP